MPSEPELTQRSQHQILADLRNAAALLYPEESSARVIVDDAGLDARQIAFSSRAESNWHNIWLTAIRQNQVDALVVVLAEHYPSHPPLQAAIANYQRFLAAGGQFNAQALLADSAPDGDAPALGESPYQGMAYYDVADADRFFGREALTAELVDHLRQQPLLAVVGASGSGKSSLVRAGVMPALQGKMPLVDGKQPPTGSARWAYHLITPTARPLESLAASLTRSSESVTATSTLIDDLGRDARSLHLYARRLVSGEQRLLLLVDQFEELFTLCKNETEQGAFVDNLLYAAQPDNDPKNSVVTLVLTLRADFYHHCARFPALRTALENQQKYIGAMTPDELRRAIEEPAKAGAWEFQAGLVEQLLQDVGHEPGALPLLSHALLETWHRRRGRTLTLAGYRAAGGVQGAIAKTADEVFNRFTDEQKSIARIIFLRLTELGEGVQDTRRRVRPDELKLTHAGANEVQQVLKTLADTRLVTTDDDEIQVAHEALIRNWDTLREWLADDREGNRIQRRLTEAANQWVEFGKDANLLYRGMLLQQAQEWMTETINPPNQIEMSFLQTSQTAVEAAAKQVAELAAEREANRQRELEQSQVVADTQRRRVKTFRWAVVITMVLTVIAAVAAIVAIGQRQIARAGELAANAKANLDTDPELSLLLAQSSLDMVYTPNGEVVLRQALQKSRIEAMLPYTATEIMQMSIQPDHKAFLTSDKRGILEYRSSTTGELLYRYTTNQGEVNSIVFAPKHHNLIAFGTLSGTISLLDLDSGDMNQLVLANPSQITSIAFTPDETGIIFGRGKYIEHWNRNTNQLQQPQIVPDVFVIRFSPDQRFVVIGTWSGEIIIWDAHLGNKPVLSWQGHKDALAEIVFSRDGRSFATAGMDRVIKLWAWPIIPSNSNAPRLLQEFTGHYSTINSIAFSPNDKCLASASNDQKVILWDTLLSKELASFAHQDPVYAVIFAENSQKDMTLTALPCGGRRLTTIDKRGTIRHWNLGPTFEYAVLPLSDQPINSLAVSPDRRFMAAAGDDGKVYLLDPFTKTNPILQKFSDMPLIVDLDFHMDGKWLATASEKGSATLWNISESASDPIIFSGLIDTEVLDVEFRPPDGQQIATISSDRKLRLWETSTAKLLGVFPLQYNPVALAFDTDGDNLIVGNRHRQAIVIETAKMITVTSLQHDNTVSFVEFSPNSDQFVTGDTDGNVTFHSFSSANEAQRRSVHSGPLYEADFSPNGRLLVTTGGDGKIVIWDVAATRPQSIIQEEPGLIYDVKFINTPDGLGIAAAGSDGTVRFYLVVIDALKAFAQTRITRQLTLDECNSYFNQGMCRN